MGIDWIMVLPKEKKYICLPKKGEWCNELWKIWYILQNIESGERIYFLKDTEQEYKNICNNEFWSEEKFTDICWDYLIYNAEDLVCGGHTALYHAARIMEKQKDY